MKRNKKGFTIVELVIVIAVIAILSAILIPTFVNLTDKANESRIKSEVADANTAFVMDASDGYVGEAEETKAAFSLVSTAFSDAKAYKKGEIVKKDSVFYKAKAAVAAAAWDAGQWDVVTMSETEIKVPEFTKMTYHIVREGVEYEADEVNGGWKKAESALGGVTLKALSYSVGETEAAYSYETALYNKCSVIYKLA